MKIRIALLFIVIYILLTLNVSLADVATAEEPLTLQQCLDIAFKNNPAFKSQHFQYDASKARVSQARAFPQPEVSLDYDLQNKLFDFKHSDEAYIGVNLPVEFPGRRIIRGKIARRESDQTGCDLQQARLELASQVKEAFYLLLLVREQAKYASENLGYAQDFLHKAVEKYESGDVSKLEVLRARVEAARAKNQQKTALNQIKLAKTRLNFLLAREKHQPIEITGSLKPIFPDLRLPQLTGKAMDARPEIKKAQLALQQHKLSRTAAYMTYLPDFSLGVARHRISGEPSTWDVSLSFQVPLFFWQPAKGEIAEANANIRAQQQDLKFTQLSVALEVENAFLNLVNFKDQAQFLEKEVLKEAETVYDMSVISYKEGKIGSIELIESRKTLLEIKQSYAETLYNCQLALAELEKSVGAKIIGG